MDARVTKHRLANMLSYDWLKILVAVVFAIAALSVFFTMVRTRATDGQTFIVYGHAGLNATERANSFDDELVSKKAFSYDVLSVTVENFTSGYMAEAAFAARRAAGEGTVIFVSNQDKDDPETEVTEVSDLWTIAGYGYDSDLQRPLGPADYADEGSIGNALDVRVFFQDVEKELAKFFGANWREAAEPMEEPVRAAFSARNGKDNRFRFSSAKFEAGVRSEAERVKKLRDDYLAVQEAFAAEKLTYIDYPAEEGEPCAFAVGLGNLGRIGDLYTYSTETGTATKDLCLMLFNNGKRLGDLKYEPVSFLRYLADTFYAG